MDPRLIDGLVILVLTIALPLVAEMVIRWADRINGVLDNEEDRWTIY